MLNPLYVLHAGDVVSRSDGQLHHITANRLVMLFGLRAGEYVFAKERTPGQQAPDYGTTRPLIHLFPRNDGDYCRPTWIIDGEATA